MTKTIKEKVIGATEKYLAVEEDIMVVDFVVVSNWETMICVLYLCNLCRIIPNLYLYYNC